MQTPESIIADGFKEKRTWVEKLSNSKNDLEFLGVYRAGMLKFEKVDTYGFQKPNRFYINEHADIVYDDEGVVQLLKNGEEYVQIPSGHVCITLDDAGNESIVTTTRPIPKTVVLINGSDIVTVDFENSVMAWRTLSNLSSKKMEQ